MTPPGAPTPEPYAYVKARDDSPKIIRFARIGLSLMLINGLTGQDEDSGHDFQYLFGHWGVMSKDTLYAGRMRTLAGMLVFISIVGGLWSAWKQKPKVNQSFDEEERLGEALSS